MSRRLSKVAVVKTRHTFSLERGAPRGRAPAMPGRAPPRSACLSTQEQVAHLDPRLGRERQGLDINTLVVPMEAPGHGLRRQGAGAQAEAVGDGAARPEVGRVGEAHEETRQELRARIVVVHDLTEHVPERRPRGRYRGWLGEERLDLDLARQIA